MQSVNRQSVRVTCSSVTISKLCLQEVSNNLAKLSVCACARLGGYLIGNDATPDNPAVKKSLAALLTPYLSKKLTEDSPANVGANSVLQVCHLNSELITRMQRPSWRMTDLIPNVQLRIMAALTQQVYQGMCLNQDCPCLFK
jgi:hypothetical protein